MPMRRANFSRATGGALMEMRENEGKVISELSYDVTSNNETLSSTDNTILVMEQFKFYCAHQLSNSLYLQ